MFADPPDGWRITGALTHGSQASSGRKQGRVVRHDDSASSFGYPSGFGRKLYRAPVPPEEPALVNSIPALIWAIRSFLRMRRRAKRPLADPEKVHPSLSETSEIHPGRYMTCQLSERIYCGFEEGQCASNLTPRSDNISKRFCTRAHSATYPSISYCYLLRKNEDSGTVSGRLMDVLQIKKFVLRAISCRTFLACGDSYSMGDLHKVPKG